MIKLNNIEYKNTCKSNNSVIFFYVYYSKVALKQSVLYKVL